MSAPKWICLGKPMTSRAVLGTLGVALSALPVLKDYCEGTPFSPGTPGLFSFVFGVLLCGMSLVLPLIPHEPPERVAQSSIREIVISSAVPLGVYCLYVLGLLKPPNSIGFVQWRLLLAVFLCPVISLIRCYKVNFLRGRLVLPAMLCTSLFLSVVYTIMNQDPHHWGFASGAANQYLAGKSLFSEVYVQYGVGQVYLLSKLAWNGQVLYNTAGFVALGSYLFTLCLLFGLVRHFAPAESLRLFLLAFLTHPYIVFPAVEYTVGMLVLAACCLFFASDGRRAVDFRFFLTNSGCALLLLGAVLFRTTMAMSVAVGLLMFVSLVYIFKREVNRSGVFVGVVFSFGCLGLVWCFHSFGVLADVIAQCFGVGAAAYKVSPSSGVVKILGFMNPFRWTLPGGFGEIVLSLLLSLSCVSIVVWNKSLNLRQSETYYKVMFLGCLTIGSLIQLVHIPQVWRVQNVCVYVYVIAAILLRHLLQRVVWYQLWRNVSLGVIVLLSVTFPAGGRLWPLFERPLQEYTFVKSPYLGGHLLPARYAEYYDAVYDVLATEKMPVLNLTNDSTLSQLVPDGGGSVSSVSCYPWGLNISESERHMIKSVFSGVGSRMWVVVASPDTEGFPVDPLSVAPDCATLVAKIWRPAGLHYFLEPSYVYIFRREESLVENASTSNSSEAEPDKKALVRN